jgi:hypothetical protein
MVHGLPSSQLEPFGAAGFEQSPLVGSHVPATWHWSSAVQMVPVPVQVPPWQVAPVVHALPVLHGVPLVAFGLLQRPVAGLQTPAA